MDERQRLLKEALLARRPVSPTDPAWGTKLTERLQRLPEGFDQVVALCKGPLRDDACVAHPQWAQVVRQVLGLTWEWADACRTLGGFEPPDDPADDESDMDQQYAALNTVSLVLELVNEVVREKERKVPRLGVGKEAAEALLDAARTTGRDLGELEHTVRTTWRLED